MNYNSIVPGAFNIYGERDTDYNTGLLEIAPPIAGASNIYE